MDSCGWGEREREREMRMGRVKWVGESISWRIEFVRCVGGRWLVVMWNVTMALFPCRYRILSSILVQ